MESLMPDLSKITKAVPSSIHLDSYLLGWPLPTKCTECTVHPCTECYKRAIVGTSAQPYFVSCTHQQVRLGVTLAHILPSFARLPVSNTKSPRVKKTIQLGKVVISLQKTETRSIPITLY
jgi:hypothetical protein